MKDQDLKNSESKVQYLSDKIASLELELASEKEINQKYLANAQDLQESHKTEISSITVKSEIEKQRLESDISSLQTRLKNATRPTYVTYDCSGCDEVKNLRNTVNQLRNNNNKMKQQLNDSGNCHDESCNDNQYYCESSCDSEPECQSTCSSEESSYDECGAYGVIVKYTPRFNTAANRDGARGFHGIIKILESDSCDGFMGKVYFQNCHIDEDYGYTKHNRNTGQILEVRDKVRFDTVYAYHHDTKEYYWQARNITWVRN